MNKITESAIEKFAIELLEKQGCHYIYAPDIAPDSDSTGTMHRATTRQSFEDVLLMERLQTAVGRIKPQWHNDDLKKGVIKVVMTSVSSDGPEISRHHTTKDQRRALADRMKDPEDELKLVIVRDMWLTGFDVPCMHTLYIDKPMKGLNLMQAIARVNRVYKDKPGGLVVDYLGIASDLKKALSFYSDSGGKGDPAIAQEKAVQMMLEKLEVVFHLEKSIKKYHNKILTAAEVIDELIELSKEIQKMDKEPQGMGMSDFEYAFYTAIANNDSAREVMEKDKLRELAVVLFEKVKANASIDWTIKENVKAKLKVIVKRTLRQYGYPPDMQKLATETVLKQAELIAEEITRGE